MLPLVGVSTLRMARAVVVLPQPDSPTMLNVSPALTSNDTPSTAFKVRVSRRSSGPRRTGKKTCRSSTCSMGGPLEAADCCGGLCGAHAPTLAAAVAPDCRPMPAAYTSCARQHSDVCPGLTMVSGGLATWHCAMASVHRGANGQPGCST